MNVSRNWRSLRTRRLAVDVDARVDELKGLISAVSPGLIKAAADQVIRHAWTAVRKAL